LAYQIDMTLKARKQFTDLPSVVKPRVAEVIGALADDPRPSTSQELEGLVGYRIHSGDYRILYVIDDKAKVVTIYRVKHRRDVYRGN